MKKWAIWTWACLISTGAYSAQPNSVSTYLQGAELQVETPAQRMELRRVLQDLLTEMPGDPEWLARRRYADYQGREGAWSAPMLLGKYIVPKTPSHLDEKTFYRDVQTAEAQAEVRKWIDALRQRKSAFRESCPSPVHIEERLKAPTGWTLSIGSKDRKAQSISLFSGSPKELGLLKPYNGDEQSAFYYWTELDAKRPLWMSCEYGGASALSRAIPRGLTFCEADYAEEVVLRCD